MLDQVQFDTELLSPAGSMEAVRAAVQAGADAVYMGGPLFGARAYAVSTEEDSLVRALDYCHLRGVKLYVTINTLIKQREYRALGDFLDGIREHGPDAVIVQDPGVLAFVREHYPEMKIHMSTQAVVTGPRYASLLMERGAGRLVLARELSLREIADIYRETGAELEVFVHGALCCSVSGLCLMSSFWGGRSGNRGKCAGPCRLPYELFTAKGEELSCGPEYLLSMKDLMTLERLREMLTAGVYSLKIEGRMKSPEYTAAVTAVYRKALDLAAAGETRAHGRDMKAGCAGREAGEEPGAYRCDATGAVRARRTGRSAFVDEEDVGLKAEIDGMSPAEAVGFLGRVYDRGGFTDAYLDTGLKKDMITPEGRPARKSGDARLMKRIRDEFIDIDDRVRISGRLRLVRGEVPCLEFAAGDVSVSARGDCLVEKARTYPLSRAEVEARMRKLGGTDFILADLGICMDEGIFIPAGALNRLRRSAAEALRRELLSEHMRTRRSI